MNEQEQRVSAADLEEFTFDVLSALGISSGDARIVAQVLVNSDVRGIDSHGVPRLTGYCKRIQAGAVNLTPEYSVVTETPATLAIDADNGMGPPVSKYAMQRCIEKAKETGLCMTTVRNSNHFGIAGYYAMMALEEGLCGVAMTNATPLVVPTFAKTGYLSTAPIAVAIPAGEHEPIVIDFATSTVAWGKIEIARRSNKPIPAGWAVDKDGLVTTDPY
ncbi:MAG: Ldh family oxidoreductase, partial [Thermomicrobiaceae bacterium]